MNYKNKNSRIKASDSSGSANHSDQASDNTTHSSRITSKTDRSFEGEIDVFKMVQDETTSKSMALLNQDDSSQKHGDRTTDVYEPPQSTYYDNSSYQDGNNQYATSDYSSNNSGGGGGNNNIVSNTSYAPPEQSRTELISGSNVSGSGDRAIDIIKANTYETLEQGAITAKAGVGSAISGTGSVIHGAISSTATQINRYTPDVYDVGNYGQTDLTKDAGMFILGNSAMLTQNAWRLSRIPRAFAHDQFNQRLYSKERMEKAKLKSEKVLKEHGIAKLSYAEIMSGKSRKDITKFGDRIAWRRYQKGFNEAGGLSFIEKMEAMRWHRKAGAYDRMVRRKGKADLRVQQMRNRSFSLKRSTNNMIKNQSRKITNQIIQGNDANSMTNRSVWAFAKTGSKSAKYGSKAAKALWKSKRAIWNTMTHPVQAVKAAVSAVLSMISSVVAFLVSIPVVASVIAAIMPVLIVILCIVVVVSSLFNYSTQVEASSVNVSVAASKDYAVNAFIYEAKKRDWKENAIIGVLAYMLQEGISEMGTFTYESYWCVEGPSGVTNDKTMDNDAWKKWMDSTGKVAMRNTSSYSGRGDLYAAFGIGLLADSDVWKNPTTKSTKKATELINYCDAKGKAWQDPETQLGYYFEKVLIAGNAGTWDTPSSDPTKSEYTADRWCREITAGYGMPSWTIYSNGDGMLAHTAKIPEATQYVHNYKNFSYVDVSSGTGDISGNPDFSNTDVWITMNRYQGSLIGQCTWFAWGRFYEIYGYDPCFSGNGYECVGQLLAAHPNEFKFSTEPSAGAVGSCNSANNHVFIVVAVDGENVTVQEGNVREVDWNYPFSPGGSTDRGWWTYTWTKSALAAKGSTYAVPITSPVSKDKNKDKKKDTEEKNDENS